jgi:hypothetical protein
LAAGLEGFTPLREAVGGVAALLEALGAMAMLPLVGTPGGAVRAAGAGGTPIDPAGVEVVLLSAGVDAAPGPDEARSAAIRSLGAGRAGEAGAGGVTAGAVPADGEPAVPPGTEPVIEGGAPGAAGTALAGGGSADADAAAGAGFVADPAGPGGTARGSVAGGTGTVDLGAVATCGGGGGGGALGWATKIPGLVICRYR